MTDIESTVFNIVATALRTAFTGIYVSGEQTAAPSSFPAATLVEMDNTTHYATVGIDMSENHSDVMYQADAFSSLASGYRKSECKAIMEIIDSKMMSLGFIRVGRTPQELINADPTKYRMMARYRGTVGESIDGAKIKIYGR